MSKKATVNGFTGGLSIDLNPLTNTKEVLSDAVNATLVTGNGDEMILQNDMGNIPLGSIPEGYVPVGCKEYGGIAYIALYNPKTKKCQLGTYPSPESYTEKNNSNGSFKQNPFDILSGTPIVPIDNINYSSDIYITKNCIDNITYGSNVEITINNFVDYVNMSSGDMKMWDYKWQKILSNSQKEDVSEKSATINGNNCTFVLNNRGNTGQLILHLHKRHINKILNTVNFIRQSDVSKLKNLTAEETQVFKNIPKNGGVFIFNSTYYWDCPDGIGSNCGAISNVINGIKYVISTNSGDTEVYYDHTTSKDREKDGDTGYWKRSVQTYCYIKSFQPSEIFNIKIYPRTYNRDQTELEDSISIAANACDNPDIYLNTWNYKVYNNQLVLTWGFYDISLYKQGISNIVMKFYDIYTNTIDHIKTIEKRSTYNGSFVNSVTGLQPNTIYFVIISFTAQNSQYEEYRWVNTSSLYNSCTLKDFGDISIVPYNLINIPLDLSETSDSFQTVDSQKTGTLLSSNTQTKAFSMVVNNTISNYYNMKGITENNNNNNIFTINPENLEEAALYTFSKSKVSSSQTSFEPKVIGNQDTSFVKENQAIFKEGSLNAICTSAKTDATLKKLGYTDTYLKVSFQCSQAASASSKLYTGAITFNKYFRPFVLDPLEVSKNLREKLKSNYYAFGYEIDSDYLPKYYYMTQVACKNDDEGGLPSDNLWYRQYVVDRTNIDTGYYINSNGNKDFKLYDNNGTLMDDNYQDTYVELDDSAATHTDVGAIYNYLTEETITGATSDIGTSQVINNFVQGYGSSLNNSIYGELADNDFDNNKNNWWNGSYTPIVLGNKYGHNTKARANLTIGRNADNSFKDTVDQFTILQTIMSNNTKAANKFIPTFCFWGSAYLTDFVQKDTKGNYSLRSQRTHDYQHNGVDVPGYEGNSNTDSGIAITYMPEEKGGHKYFFGSCFKSLFPFWLDSQGVYSSLNYGQSIQIDSDWQNPDQMRAKDISPIIKTLLSTFKNYYVYTKSTYTVDNANITIADTQNMCYSDNINNTLTISDFALNIPQSILQIGDVNYDSQVTSILNTRCDESKIYNIDKSVNSTKAVLTSTAQYSVRLIQQKVDYQYSINPLQEILSSINDVSNISYPVLLEPISSPNTDININGNIKAKETDTANKDKYLYKKNACRIITDIYRNDEESMLDVNSYYTLSGDTPQEHPFDLYDVLLPIRINIDSSTEYSTLILNNGNNTNKNYWVVPNNVTGEAEGANVSSLRSLPKTNTYKSSGALCAPTQMAYKHNRTDSAYCTATYCNIPINVGIYAKFFNYDVNKAMPNATAQYQISSYRP